MKGLKFLSEKKNKAKKMQSIKYPYAVCVENKGKHFVAGPIIVKAVKWERIAGQSYIALRLIVT